MDKKDNHEALRMERLLKEQTRGDLFTQIEAKQNSLRDEGRDFYSLSTFFLTSEDKVDASELKEALVKEGFEVEIETITDELDEIKYYDVMATKKFKASELSKEVFLYIAGLLWSYAIRHFSKLGSHMFSFGGDIE